MQNGYWVIRTYISGSVGEKIKYWVSGQKPTKGKTGIKKDVNKLEKNEKQSEKNLARILNANFGESGMLVGLDYSDAAYRRLFGECSSREEIIQIAEHQMSLCLRRVQREAKKRGIEVKAVPVTADMDGETKEQVRVHHHVVVNIEAAELFGEKWKHGKRVDYKYLQAQKDRTPLAHYLMEQHLHIPNSKAYITTRNLDRPKCVDRIARNGAEIALPRNCELLYRSAHTMGFNQYLRYRILNTGSRRSEEVEQRGTGNTDSILRVGKMERRRSSGAEENVPRPQRRKTN